MTNLNTYPGVNQTNPLDLDERRPEGTDRLANIKTITRVRLLTEVRPGYGRIADISYIWGWTKDGKLVNVVGYPATGLLRNVKRDFIKWAQEEGVYGKGIGLLDEGNWSIMY